jgi:hypothetical protein
MIIRVKNKIQQQLLNQSFLIILIIPLVLIRDLNARNEPTQCLYAFVLDLPLEDQVDS